MHRLNSHQRTFRRSAWALAAVGATLVHAAAPAWAVGLIYVDADDGFNGPANLSPLSNINLTQSTGDDGLWGYRGDGGANSPGATFRSVFEASSGASEDVPQITQTLTGLGGNTAYDVYVAYWQGATGGHDWNIRAGFTPGAMTLFNANGPTELMPDAVAGVHAGYHQWDSPPVDIINGETPMFIDEGRSLLLGKVGTATSSPSGQLAVVLDDLPATIEGANGNNHRTWHDGLAYVAAGTDVFVAPGDFNNLGGIDAADAQIFLQNLNTDTTFLPLTETYQRGDVNLDGSINHADFVQFKQIYNDANGGGAFEAYVASVPEPSSWALLAVVMAAVVIHGVPGRRQQQKLAFQKAVIMASWKKTSLSKWCFAGLACTMLAGAAHAAPVTGWIAVHSGDGGPTDAPLTAADTDAPVLGDGTNNSAGQVALYADIAGAIDAAADVSLANGESVTFSGSATLEGSASSMENFRFGLFNEAAPPLDAIAWKGYLANNSAENSGGALRAKIGNHADFNTATFVSTSSGRGVNLQTARDGDPFVPGTYDFSMTVSRFGADLLIDASLTSAAADFSQVWESALVTPNDEDDLLTYDFNRVGFLSGNPLSADRISFSDLDVSTGPVESLFLQVNTSGPDAGRVQIVNPSGQSFTLDYYEISSPAGSLDAGGWLSFDDQDGNDEVTQGWDEAASSDANQFTEINLQGATTIGPGGGLTLGNAFNVGGAQDLVFSFGLPGSENLARGIVEYGVFDLPSAPGDFDDDGDVDGADLGQWKGAFGQGPGGDADGDQDSDGADFLIWQRNLTGGQAAPAATAVPEPCLAALVWALPAAAAVLRRRCWPILP